MSRTLLLDIPRNVTRQEHAIYTLQCGLVLVGLCGAVGILLASMRGDAGRTIEALDATPGLAVAEAAASLEGMALVRIEGKLEADTSAVMPDDPGVEVVLGEVELSAKLTEAGTGSREAVLHRWEHHPGALWLSDGAERVRLQIDPELIPRTRKAAPGRPKRLTDGASARVSRTVGYRYFDQDWPLPEEWASVRSASARVERSYVEMGSPFVAVGQLVPGKDGAALVVARASGGAVHAGTLLGIRQSSQRLGTRLRFAWLPLLLGSAWLLVRVLRIRRDFVRRSNEA